MQHYVNDAAFYIAKHRGISIEKAAEFVKSTLRKGGRFEFKDPKIEYFKREENGDRVRKEGTLLAYISDSVSKNELIAPTFTTYTPPSEKQSLLVDFIDSNVAARSRAKKAEFKARMEGNTQLKIIKNIEQGLKKISNNSISGAHVSSSTPLANKSAHSTLTSNCRSTSGNGNANNEKMLSGNRHYWGYKVTVNNIVSIVNHTDYDALEKAMIHHGIRFPTVDETYQCVKYSTDLYWFDIKAHRKIYNLISKLTDIERAAFVYTGDLYHLCKYNEEIVLTFIKKLSTPIRENFENAAQYIKSNREEYRILASELFYSELKGKKPEDISGTIYEEYIASSIKNIIDTINEYALFIKAFFVTTNVPASLGFLPQSIRRSALTSDTDSTIFTVQDWVFKIFGENAPFNDETYAVESTIVFLAAETITHILARMSANFGVEEKRIHQIAMKNEFKFDVFVPTNVGKHYFAYISCQEGNIYKEFDKEIKGVHLKSSNVPKVIMKQADEMMTEIMDTVIRGEKISIHKFLTKVADTEREVKRSIMAGESTYFRNAQVKSADSYTKSEDLSPYQNYTFWQEVFAPKYGDAPPPPYSCSKVCLKLKSPKVINAWIETIKDQQLKNRLIVWFNKVDKSSIKSFLLPQDLLRTSGMPEELEHAIDMRKAIFDNTFVFYILAETIGYYCVNKGLTRLISDEF
jgi:hypothetical protein